MNSRITIAVAFASAACSYGIYLLHTGKAMGVVFILCSQICSFCAGIQCMAQDTSNEFIPEGLCKGGMNRPPNAPGPSTDPVGQGKPLYRVVHVGE